MNKKQEQAFWKAVGFKEKRHKIEAEGYKPIYTTIIIAPDGTKLNEGYPAQDANNFFKYVVPFLFRISQHPQLIITIKNDGKYDSNKKVAYLYKHAAGAYDLKVE